MGELSREALECLKDFERWCDRYERYLLYGWQREAWRFAEQHDHSMVLAPPRHGKTETFSVRMPTWLACGGGFPPDYYENAANPLRNTQTILVSKSQAQAVKNFRAISRRLTLNRKLIDDFGRFRSPDLPWQESDGGLIVDGREVETESGDFSLFCVGSGSAVLGYGAQRIICDDPADLKNARTPEQVGEILNWLRSEVFSRLEPGGRVFVLGARLPVANEPYGQLEDLPLDDIDDDEAAVEDVPIGDFPRLFATMVKPAVLEWDQRELLCPERWSWKTLMQARSRAGAVTWESMWMQSRQPLGVGLARREWIYGDDAHIGCLDADRGIGEPRVKTIKVDGEERPVPSIRVLSIDPSPSMFTAALIMDVPQTTRFLYEPGLLDIRREKLTAPNVIQLMEEWYEAYHYKVLIFERNAAQQWLLQMPEFQEFQRRSGVQLIPHFTTGDKKGHPEYGKQTLASDFEFGRIRIPAGSEEARWKFNILIREALEEVRTDDTLMALWFPKWHLQGLVSVRPEASWPGFGVGAPIGPPPRLLSEGSEYAAATAV